MILKAIGCLLLVAVFSFAGYAKAQTLKKREGYIKKLEDFVVRLSLELTYSRTNLIEIFSQLKHEQNFLELAFIKQTADEMDRDRSFSDGFSISLSDELKRKKECSEELSVLTGLTNVLGAADIKEQQQSLKLCQTRLHDIYIKAREEHQKKSKMYRSIGLLSGIMVALVLI